MSHDVGTQWIADRVEILTFAGILVRADWLDTAQEVLDYFEKPWKWTVERELWIACGRPDFDDEGWNWFTAKLEQQRS